MTSYIEQYCARIRRGGAAAVIAQPVVVAIDGHYAMSYVPFEHSNPAAKLVLVSITPGHSHIRLAAQLTETLLQAHAPGRVLQLENKRQVELGGPLVRPNAIRMLDHFGIPQLVGAPDAAALWGDSFPLLQPLALLPHATTRRGLAFDGTLEELLAVPIMRQAYETLFLQRLERIDGEALCIGFGRTAWAGLQHAVRLGVLKPTQLLGMMPVPTRAGSMVRYYLGEISPDALSDRDPVRHRIDWLDMARHQLIERVRQLRRDGRGEARSTAQSAA